MLPDWLQAVLPTDTQHTWEVVRQILPAEAYLVGGTALAVHLHHRVSRDLDFFLEAPVDLDLLESALRRVGPLVVTGRDDQTLNGVFSSTNIQFLEASDQRIVEPTTTVEGIRVAAVGDLLATKLKVILDRPALRDYFDLLTASRTLPPTWTVSGWNADRMESGKSRSRGGGAGAFQVARELGLVLGEVA